MHKVGDVEYQIDATAREGMKVPVTIFANEALIAKMETDRTIDQAVNVAHFLEFSSTPSCSRTATKAMDSQSEASQRPTLKAV